MSFPGKTLQVAAGSRRFAALPGAGERETCVTDELPSWIKTLDGKSKAQFVDAVDRLAGGGPGLGRPLVDRLEGSQVHDLKELRPGSSGRSEVRIVFVFDPWRSAILSAGGAKPGDWSGWYRRAIPLVEELYAEYVKEREAEEGQR